MRALSAPDFGLILFTIGFQRARCLFFRRTGFIFMMLITLLGGFWVYRVLSIGGLANFSPGSMIAAFESDIWVKVTMGLIVILYAAMVVWFIARHRTRRRVYMGSPVFETFLDISRASVSDEIIQRLFIPAKQ